MLGYWDDFQEMTTTPPPHPENFLLRVLTLESFKISFQLGLGALGRQAGMGDPLLLLPQKNAPRQTHTHKPHEHMPVLKSGRWEKQMA